MSRDRLLHFTPAAVTLVVASFLNANALAQSTTGTSAQALGLSDYRHFVIYPHLEKALRAQKNNDEQTALKEFRHIHAQVPDNIPLTLYLAAAYRYFDHNNQARQLLTEQLKRHPDDPRLLQQLEAIPRKNRRITSIEELRVQQKACDAEPGGQCRSEIGQYALNLEQLAVARAQLDDAAFAASDAGKALATGILQRAIYLKAWPVADEILSLKQQQYPLSEAEQAQWLEVLLAGEQDTRLLALQSQGLLNSASMQLVYAGSLESRSETARLQTYLATHHPRFDNARQEQSWLYLLSRYSASPHQAMLAYKPQFTANQHYVVGAALPEALKAGDHVQAQMLLDSLPADQMLAERYTLSRATHNREETLRLARLMYQRSPQNLRLLDQLTWQLMQEGQEQEATQLLLARYPFAGDSSESATLIARLAGLLTAHPQWVTPGQLARLSKPLPDTALRQAQSQLPGISTRCDALRPLLDDLSSDYNASTWRRLAHCYQPELPGMALYTLQQARQRQPDLYQTRAVAWQAYAVEEYAIALRAWNTIPLSEMRNEDLMAAANTAQVAGDAGARDRFIDAAQGRGLDNSENWWWLHAQRYLPAQPAQAIADLNQAIAIEPTSRALTARAALLWDAKRTQEAVNDLRQALVIDPGNSVTQAALGYALWDQGAYLPSRSALEKALAASPDDPQLIRQLMYVNQRLGDTARTQHYARQVIDELDADAEVAPLTAAQRQEHFNARRVHEDIGRRWTFNFDTSLGLNSGAISPFSSQTSGSPSAQGYRSYGQLEAEYRLGRNMLLEGDMLSVYGRLFARTTDSNVVLPVQDPMLGAGLRWKPLSDYTLFFAIEEQVPLAHHDMKRDTLLRASASFLNGGQYSDEWHPNARGWFAQNLYFDAAYYMEQHIKAWTADYRASWHQKVASNQTIEPYAHVQANGYRDEKTQGAQLGGVGVRWNIWTGQQRYDAWPHKISLGLEYQHTFKAINADSDERNNAFLTVGVHW